MQRVKAKMQLRQRTRLRHGFEAQYPIVWTHRRKYNPELSQAGHGRENRIELALPTGALAYLRDEESSAMLLNKADDIAC